MSQYNPKASLPGSSAAPEHDRFHRLYRPDRHVPQRDRHRSSLRLPILPTRNCR